MTSLYPAGLQLNDLLHSSKALEPLSAESATRLAEVATLDVSTYSEMDVRAEVIDPIVRALGYQKQTDFSTQREKNLKILSADAFPDYSMMLFEENFWIIEAKKVRQGGSFTGADVKQALVYAAHPDINAALLVLCDGRILHVFDREETLSKPALEIEIAHIVRDFDKLRRLLSPWQTWFFQKRRVLRLLDKVFDHEINMSRLREFRELVERRLISKNGTVLKNHQAMASKLDVGEHARLLGNLEPAEIVDLHFFLNHSHAELDSMSRALISRCEANSFPILHLIFPDQPRSTNDRYWASALHFLLTLEDGTEEVTWLPAYLADLGSATTRTAAATKRLIGLCLNSFEGRLDMRVVLLHSAAARRMAKQMLVMLPQLSEIGEQRHALVRHLVDEASLTQFLSSPAGHLAALLDQIQQAMSAQFVSSQRAENGRFDLDKATQSLKDAWLSERAMLGDGAKYRISRVTRAPDESAITELVSVAYDQLGHLALCILDQFPQWKEYAVTSHRSEVTRIAHYGSHKAKEWLGLAFDAPLPRPSNAEVANRFFFGDLGLYQALASGYGIAP